jgi:hypothetical protein
MRSKYFKEEGKLDSKLLGVEKCFLGTEEQNSDLIQQSRWISNPEIEFFRNRNSEELIAVVRGNSEFGGNRVYSIHDVRIIQILRAYAECSKSWITFYKKKKGS